MDNGKEKLLLIDGHSIVNRAFYGIPPLSNSEGLHTNAIMGFLNIFFKAYEEFMPDYCLVAFDVKKKTFRHEMYAEYKGTRKPMPEELNEQVPVLKDVLHSMGIKTVELPGYEADDVLGTYANIAGGRGVDVVILSGDRDLLQLATDSTMVALAKTSRGSTEIEKYYAAGVKEKYGVSPLEFIDMKALMGDTSDNIPGIPGIGEKTASKLIQQYGSYENVCEHIDEVKPDRAKNSLRENMELGRLSKELATINVNSPVEIDFTESSVKDESIFYNDGSYKIYKKLELKKLLERFDMQQVNAADEIAFEVRSISRLPGDIGKMNLQTAKTADPGIKDKEQDTGSGRKTGIGLFVSPECAFAAIACSDGIYVYTSDAGSAGTDEGDDCAQGPAADVVSESGKQAEGVQASIFNLIPGGASGETAECGSEMNDGCTCHDAAGNVKAENELEKNILSLLKSYNGGIYCEGLKNILHSVHAGDFDAENIYDIDIMAYLLDPLKNGYSYDGIAQDYLGKVFPSKTDLIGKMSEQEALTSNRENVFKMAAYSAKTAFEAFDVLGEKLKESGMLDLFTDMEMPLVYSLYRMETEGVQVDREALAGFSGELLEMSNKLQEEIYEEAEEEFNINSPLQLGNILFEKMKLPHGKKTKKGYSTSADVLEKLAGDYPIVDKVLKYRQVVKLRSTYAEGLQAFISDDGRIHGNFNQTVTATGRLSSADPNLQNIPIRNELGAEIRKAFAAKDGCVFLDADYSQIELRLLAHISDDKNLIEAYHSDADIHKITASKVFNTPLDRVTKEQRRNAKAVNFGIVYGISSFGLSQDLNLSRKQAAEYINQYFATYPGVKEYLDNTVRQAKADGYVTTMYGRRRPIPELSSGNFVQRSFGERAAMNAPIQGSAADIMKLAMINVDRALREAGLAARIVLQIHDELLVETPENETDQVKEILENEMKNVVKLSVPLEVEVTRGKNWLEAH